MIGIKIDSAAFTKDMNNIIGYANGFLDGVQAGKTDFFNSFAKNTMEVLSGYIDSNARVQPETLHHIYEWHQVGNPGARLFDIDYSINAGGISVNATLRQSQSVKDGSSVPFYNKARIIENGIPVKISPVKARALSFNDNGEEVFTSSPVIVTNPGGAEARGGFSEIFESFFRNYFTQAFLVQSGIGQMLTNARDFNKNFSKAKTGGRPLGFTTGKQWITKAGNLGV